MADNVNITPGTGNIIAADEVVDAGLGTVKVQYVKIMDGTVDGTSKAAVGANGLKVDPSAVTQPVAGNSASAATDAGNPVKTGGVFNTTQPTVTNGQRVDSQSTNRGAQIVATGVDPFNVNVTNSGLATSGKQDLQTTALNQIVTNTGTASTDTIASGTINALNGVVSVNAQGTYTVSVSVTGTWVGTIVAEGKLADGTFVIIPIYIVTPSLPYASAFSSTVNGTFLITGGGYTDIRIRASAFTSGTIAVALDASLAQQTAFMAQLGTWNIQNITGAVSLPTGASTDASLTNGNARAKITDGTNNAAVKAASTAPTFADPAVVVALSPNGQAVYRAATALANAGVLVAAASTAPFFVLYGSATKTIVVTRIFLSGATTTAVAYAAYILSKYSTAPTGGTAQTLTQTPEDSNNAAATASLCQGYTAAPTAGTLVGAISSKRTLLQATVASASGVPDIVEFDLRQNNRNGVVLRGTAQGIGINFGAAPATAVTLAIAVEWFEI